MIDSKGRGISFELGRRVRCLNLKNPLENQLNDFSKSYPFLIQSFDDVAQSFVCRASDRYACVVANKSTNKTPLYQVTYYDSDAYLLGYEVDDLFKGFGEFREFVVRRLRHEIQNLESLLRDISDSRESI